MRLDPRRLLHSILGRRSEPPPEDPGPPPLPQELLVLLRDLGVALCRSGEASDRAAAILHDVAACYGVHDVEFFVMPTVVLVRVGDADGSAHIDFSLAEADQLRLDQIARLYDLITEIGDEHIDPVEATDKLRHIIADKPRFRPWVTIAAFALLALGLGLIRNPAPVALFGYALLGAMVGALQLISKKIRVLTLGLPVAAAILVTFAAYTLPDAVTGGDPTALLLPPLVMFLPGAALTIGTIELASGSMMAGSARLAYAVIVLLLLSFGILIGTEITDVHTGHPAPTLGWWAPWLGVLITGIGHFLNSSGPARSLPWLLLVLYGVWLALRGGDLFGSALFGAFLAGLVLTPLSYFVQTRPGGPPAQVSFLPAFWLIVPGTLGLTGVSELVTGAKSVVGGVNDLVTTLLTVLAIALGVLVGSSLAPTTRKAVRATVS
ncbi:hypothetical protein Afil01_64470 [Actinorhabdospora filicis]|uniref:Threonine/serine exporter-like N-terminal domain-containing protein n=1 Tax=Actinorhabdospora filicis TaxID=1785913 RepID=A0A9W6SRK3_9ACTN|nr:threonine/serine exporter family protein [Actinorhabdospora filicis]GLZ81640.1 hypothetical protein Afil01_64470 [Actinorhabdospora filicis]